MRKIVILAAVLLSTQVFGQRVPLSGQSKSEAITKVRLQQMRNGQRSEWQKNAVAVGKDGEVKLIAKVGRGFDARRLTEYGITVGAMAGDIVTLRVPIDKIDVLDANPSILQYCLSERVQPTMNRTRKDTRTDSVQQGLGLPQAYTGKDVLIGITDWGFDYKHPNFNNNGESNRRLLRAWDQFKLSGPAPEGFDYGTEHVGRSALLRAEGDTSGLYGYGTHGTHVAGIAAGRGIDGNYTGQAPYANLLFASFYLDLGSWIDAVGWMKNVAREEGKRLVVNNSWGMYTLGPIDGTSLASQAINNWADSGIVFVTSGGNCGDDNFHVSHNFVSGQQDTLRTIASYYGSQSIGQAIPIWGEPGKSFKMSFAMVSETDSVCLPWVNTEEGTFYLDSSLVAQNGDSLHFVTPGEILVDRRSSQRKWMINQRVSPGIILLDDGGTPIRSSDDRCLMRSSFVDQNGKPLSPDPIYCLAQDHKNRIWVGTQAGVLLIPATTDFFTSNACQRIIIPRNDGTGLGDYLLANEQINCMAVDGGDRMWIGTANSGLYLIEDDTITVAHFTEYNSLLPSNVIQSIAIMPTTGEVFVGTDKGIASYRSDASESRSDFSGAYAYPNPVRPDYDGMISITGLMENTVVNIVDESGNLVCKTRSHGGTAVWDGKSADGHRASAGVYTALCNADGGHTVVKILVIR